jgi:hypothetical protein
MVGKDNATLGFVLERSNSCILDPKKILSPNTKTTSSLPINSSQLQTPALNHLE